MLVLRSQAAASRSFALREEATTACQTWCPDLRRWNSCESQVQPMRERSKGTDDSSIRVIQRAIACGFEALRRTRLPAFRTPRSPITKSTTQTSDSWRLISKFYQDSLELTQTDTSAVGVLNNPDPGAAH